MSISAVAVRIPRADFAYWDERVDDWVVEGGEYVLRIGSSSRNILHTNVIHLGDDVRMPLTENSTIGEVLQPDP